MFSKVKTGTASGSSGFKRLSGWNITETAGATAQVSVRDASGGNILFLINLAANESIGESYGASPLDSAGFGAENFAFYFSVDSGTVRWTAFGA